MAHILLGGIAAAGAVVGLLRALAVQLGLFDDALEAAVRSGRLERVHLALERTPALAMHTRSDHATILHVAAERGAARAVVDALLSHLGRHLGPDRRAELMAARTSRGWFGGGAESALHVAAQRNGVGLIEAFAGVAASSPGRSRDGGTSARRCGRPARARRAPRRRAARASARGTGARSGAAPRTRRRG
jgi:hypothetical protein